MGMGITELLTKIGDARIKFQNLDECATNLQKSKKGTKITFGTEQTLTFKGTEDLGLVIWLPRDVVKEALGK